MLVLEAQIGYSNCNIFMQQQNVDMIPFVSFQYVQDIFVISEVFIEVQLLDSFKIYTWSMSWSTMDSW